MFREKENHGYISPKIQSNLFTRQKNNELLISLKSNAMQRVTLHCIMPVVMNIEFPGLTRVNSSDLFQMSVIKGLLNLTTPLSTDLVTICTI